MGHQPKGGIPPPRGIGILLCTGWISVTCFLSKSQNTIQRKFKIAFQTVLLLLSLERKTKEKKTRTT